MDLKFSECTIMLWLLKKSEIEKSPSASNCRLCLKAAQTSEFRGDVPKRTTRPEGFESAKTFAWSQRKKSAVYERQCAKRKE